MDLLPHKQVDTTTEPTEFCRMWLVLRVNSHQTTCPQEFSELTVSSLGFPTSPWSQRFHPRQTWSCCEDRWLGLSVGSGPRCPFGREHLPYQMGVTSRLAVRCSRFLFSYLCKSCEAPGIFLVPHVSPTPLISPVSNDLQRPLSPHKSPTEDSDGCLHSYPGMWFSDESPSVFTNCPWGVD